jgi:hypothetical protein
VKILNPQLENKMLDNNLLTAQQAAANGHGGAHVKLVPFWMIKSMG